MVKRKDGVQIRLFDGFYDKTELFEPMAYCVNCGEEVEYCDGCSRILNHGDIIYCKISEVDENKHLCMKCVEREQMSPELMR